NKLGDFQRSILSIYFLLDFVLFSAVYSFFFSVFSTFGFSTFTGQFFQRFADLVFHLLISQFHRHYPFSSSANRFFVAPVATLIVSCTLWARATLSLLRTLTTLLVSTACLSGSWFFDPFPFLLFICSRFRFILKLRQIHCLL